MNEINYIIVLIAFLCPINCFTFSVIIAVYNTGRYLDDSLGSLVNQTIGLDKIQIILVNDGSTDNSEEICLKYQKEYSNNIIYKKIEHGGVSRARNVGLEYARGEFINFLDADDKWDPQALAYVLSFFENNTNVNIVAGRLLFFEAINGYHPLDYKFYETRVVNLTKEYSCIHLSGPSSFFRNFLIKGKKFVEGVFSGEDTIFINNILLLNPIIGYIREAIYYYRKRADHSSAVQNQVQKVDFYFSQLKYVGQYLIDKSKELYNKIVPFIQFYIGYNDLFRILSPAFRFLNSTNFIKYCKAIEDQLNQIEDKYILEQKFTSYKNKIFTLSKKYKRDLRYDVICKNNLLIYSGYIIMNLKSNNIIIWRFLELKGNKLHLEGKDDFWMPKETYFFHCKIGNKTFFPKYKHYSGYDYYTMYGLIEKGRIVIFDILIQNIKEQIIQFFISYKDINVEIFPSLGDFTDLPNVKDGYYTTENFLIKIIKRRFYIYSYSKTLEKLFEMQYLMYLKSIRKENIIKLRKKCKKFYVKKNRKKEIWIINDRRYQAGDNGEYFFRYLIGKKLKEKMIYFAIKKECNDYKRLKKFRNILDFGSKKHLELFLKSDKIISSVSDFWATNPFGEEQKYIKDLFHFYFIFIQCSLDDLPNIMNRINKNFILFITSSKREYKSILSSKYSYNINNILLTGLPRFDNLIEMKNKFNKKKLILIFPTWRPYIRITRNITTYKYIYSDEFKTTEFFKFFNDLINHKKLLLSMKKLNYTGILCLHPYISQQKKDFTPNKHFLINDLCNYQELLARSSLFITDYSNMFFDFAYIKKPLIYVQFDKEEYGKYHQGNFFDYKKDGFGPVCFDIECTIQEIIKEITINCELNRKYLKRSKKFFYFSDKNNNDRIFYALENNYEDNIRIINKYNNFFILSFFSCILIILKKILILKK